MSGEVPASESDRAAVEQPQADDEKFYFRQFPEWLNIIAYFLTRNSMWIYAKLWFRVSVHGKKNFPRRGAVMLVANHASLLDPPLCSLVTNRRLSYLAKSDLFRTPFLGYLLSMVNAFPIRRGEGDRGAIRSCVRILKENKPLLIFPEGTRSEDGLLREAKTGVAMILSQVPDTTIVPVRVDGSFDAFGRGGKKIHAKKIHITIGKPFLLSDLGLHDTVKKQLYRKIGEEIMSKISSAQA